MMRIPANPATCSGNLRTPKPIHFGQSNRLIPDSCSEAKRTPQIGSKRRWNIVICQKFGF